MFSQFRTAWNEYPRQFWLLFIGSILSTMGASMIWPFQIIYVSETLGMPIAVVSILPTISSLSGLVSSFIAGPVIDRLGRKWVMITGLLMNALGFLLLSHAHTFLQFALLMGMNGAFNPIFRVGADAMMADLIPARNRVDAYSLQRLGYNLGVALGPTIGGILATISYAFAFYCACAGLTMFGLLMLFFGKETLQRNIHQSLNNQKEAFGGYGKVLTDKPFLSFALNFALVQVSSSLIWVLMAVYAKQNYGIRENIYGLIPTTNAIMVVLFQLPITKLTKRYNPLLMMAIGAFFYASGTGLVALATGFLGFWISMVIITIGELILVPTSSTYVANLAPPEMRGRYMSIYQLTWGAATGVGPLFGGQLNDRIGPRSTWIGGGIIGGVSVLIFLFLATRNPIKEQPSYEEQ